MSRISRRRVRGWAFLDIADAPAHALVARLAAEGRNPKPHYVHCDLKDIEALKAAIAEVAAALGPITVLVNNAAHDERIAGRT